MAGNFDALLAISACKCIVMASNAIEYPYGKVDNPCSFAQREPRWGRNMGRKQPPGVFPSPIGTRRGYFKEEIPIFRPSRDFGNIWNYRWLATQISPLAGLVGMFKTQPILLKIGQPRGLPLRVHSQQIPYQFRLLHQFLQLLRHPKT